VESKVARQASSALNVTPDLIEKIVAQVQPKLEEEIIHSVLESLRDNLKKDLIKILQSELKNTQASLEENTRDFVDKVKADLKTELPAMYHASVALAQDNFSEKIAEIQTEAASTFVGTLAESSQVAVQIANSELSTHIDAMKNEANAKISKQLDMDLKAFQEKALTEHQAQLTEALQAQLASFKQSGEQALMLGLTEIKDKALVQHQEELRQDLDVKIQALSQTAEQEMTQQLREIQENVVQDLHGQLEQSLEGLLPAAVKKAEYKLQQQMVSVQENAQNNAVEHMQKGLNEAIPNIFAIAAGELKTKFTEELTAQSSVVREQFNTLVNGDMPNVQEVLQQNVERMLAKTMPALEHDLRNQLVDELKALLVKVKFVLPD